MAIKGKRAVKGRGKRMKKRGKRTNRWLRATKKLV